MVEIREILRRLQAQHSKRQIAREMGIDRKTVRRYVEAAQTFGVGRDVELTDEIVRQVADAVQGRPAIALSEERQLLADRTEQIRSWLDREEPLTLKKIHDLLAREKLEVSYPTLRRFVMDDLGFRVKKPTVRVDDPAPGQEAQADFGAMGFMIDPVSGRRRRLWVLIVTLSHSRHSFVFPTFEQTLAVVCEGLDAAWQFFGGVVRTLIVDNLKPAITKADPLSPTINPSFLEYAESRGLFIDAARVRHPKDKPRVENQVAYVRESWFQGETFLDLDDARRSAARWCREVAGTRLHGTTRKQPIIVFEDVEQSTLQTPPAERFDVPTWTEAKVHPDHHLQVARALYSVPTRFIGSTVRVRSDQKLVRIYLGSELIKVHGRVGPGERATDPADYPKHQSVYALRDVDKIINEARKRGRSIGELAERLLQQPLPWRHLRQAQAILRIADKYGHSRVDEVCARALAFDVIDVHRIERLVKAAKQSEEIAETRGKLISHPTRFARSPETFRTRTEEEEESR